MAEPVPIGSQVGGYRIEGLVSLSPTGATYRALDRSGSAVALEFVAPELARTPGFRGRLARGKAEANALEHPAIARVRDVGDAGESAYVATDWIDGVDLATLIERLGTLSFLRAAGIALQVGRVLDAAHAAGLVHGALEPRRIVVTDDEGADRVFVTGFLPADDQGSNGSRATSETWVGPPPADYAAPEQIRAGELTPATDIYALGCVLYEAASGRTPFPRETIEATLAAHLGDQAPAPSERLLELPSEFDEVIRRALAKEPDRRYASASELARAALWAGGVVPPPESERTPDKAGVISAWQRSLAAGAHLWSPSEASRGVAQPRQPEQAPVTEAHDAAAPAEAVLPAAAGPEDAAASPRGEDGPAGDEAAAATEPAGAAPQGAPRSSRRRRGRTLRVVALIVALLAAAGTVALLASSGGDDKSSDKQAATPAKQNPPARQKPPARAADRQWPERNGYTVVVGVSNDRSQAAATARRAALLGFDSGVLDSSSYSSLEPGKLVTFVGVFKSSRAAAREAARVRQKNVARAAYVRFVNGGS